MPINFLALDYISIRKTEEIHSKLSKLNKDETVEVSKFQKNFNNANFFEEKNKKTNKNLIKIENSNIYESKSRKTGNKFLKFNKKNQNFQQSNDHYENLRVNQKNISYNFNENEFNEWLTMDSVLNQSLNSIEIEEFNRFISGTPLSEINKVDDSPSYSPLESICDECFPCSQIIEMDSKLKERLETGIEKIESVMIDSYIGSMENLYISQNKIEIVIESDDESPWYDMNPFDIVDDYFENLKLKYNEKNIEKLNQTPKHSQLKDESISEDYLYRFSECLVLVKKMLDIVEKESDLEIEKKVYLLSTSTETLINKPLVNDSKLNSSVPSSITITKLNKNSSLNSSKLYQYLSIQNNEIYSKMNYYRIENYFCKIIKKCLEQLKLILNKNEISVELIKKIIENNLIRNNNPIYYLLEFCFESLDLLFNCSWSSFLKYTKIFFHNYQYMPEIENSFNSILNEIEKTQTEIEQKFSGIESPKILILLKYIQNECEKIKNSKFLIIVPRRSIELDNSLMKSLCGIKTCIIDIKDFSEMTHVEILKTKYDCLIMNYNPLIFNDLSKFTHLIIYEALKCTKLSIDKQAYFELCQKLNIRYVEFEEYKINLTFLAHNEIERATICSERVANNTFLVEFIEIELGIKLVTRNYEFIALENRINRSIICNADLLINENVGIVFQDCFHFFNYFEEEMHLFLKKIFCFKYSLRNLIIILTNSGKDSNSNILIHKNISRFLKFCKDSNRNNSNFLLSPLFVKNTESIKIVLRKIFDEFLTGEKNINFNSEPTSDEKFLLSLGCFNSFNAQLILQDCILTDLISMNLFEFKTKFSFLDDEKIEHFFRILELHDKIN